MRKTLIQILCLLILTPIVAKASTIDLPATGQAISQAVGDDGAVQAGKAWPTPRFVDNRNGTVGDNLTGLVWSGDANLLSSSTSGTNGAIIWQKALDEIKRLNASAYLGYSDWRLPNLNELASLLHQGEPVQSVWLSRNGFFNTAAVNYWSSSSFTRDASRVWAVQMNIGSVATLPKSGSALVWPVRGASNLLPATGQVACYNTAGLTVECTDTGQDGELRMGAAWPAFRFADNGNGTITDNLTGLIWPKNANPTMDAQISRAGGGSVLWTDALEFVTGLNNTSYLGFSDWRLPNHNELVSLVNYAETTPGVQLNRAGVRDIREQYWSSSSSIANSSDAWNVTMNGEVAELNKFDARLGSYIWPVRGGIETLLIASQSSAITTKTVAKAVAATAVTLSVTTSSLPSGTAGIAYSQTLGATGGTTPYTWSKKSGTLPAGLTLSTAGVISGTPTTAGTSTVTVQVKDKAAKTATKSLSITVSAAPLAITTASLSDGYLTTAYSQTLAATGGKTAYTWSITSGSLPAGLALAASTGKISGTPTTTGSTAITVQVKDANATIVSKSLILTVYALPSISTATLSAGNIGTVYSQALTATGGKTAYSWGISSGTLPAGLTLAASTGVISGTPTTAVTSSVTFKVTDANAKTATKALSITVSATPPSITTAALSDGVISFTYSQTLTATGGKTPYSWSRTIGALPVGLSLSSAGVISGTPTTAGISNFTVQVKDGNSSIATATLAIAIVPAVSVASSTLPSGNVGSAYNQTLTANGGKLPYTWSITSGTLPPGLTLDSLAGTITGTPTAAWSSSFTVQVKDVNNMTASGAMYVTISNPVSITTSALHDNFIGVAYSSSLAATGGTSPYTWMISEGSLPAGLSLDTSIGVISGTPFSTGSSNFTLQVRDAVNAVSTRAYTINVTEFGSIHGSVADQATGAPISGATVTLNLSGITSKNASDFIYTCNGIPIVTNDYGKIAGNDDIKLGCNGRYYTQAKVRNPYRATDPFTIRWNGLSAYSGGEYLAQSFRPTKSGILNKVSFYFSGFSMMYSMYGGAVAVQLKSSLGGDGGVYLASSTNKTLTPGTATGWIDFDLTAPVSVTAGQEYFIELQGAFATWPFTSGTTYYDAALWGNGIQYQDGQSYQRSGGTWGQLGNSLAFRTYVDANPDITTTLPTLSVNMHGAIGYEPNIELSNISNGDAERCYMDHSGKTESYSNSADYNCTKTVTNGNNYYNQDGWITLSLYSQSSYGSYSEMDTTLLVTDQFSLTFNRTLTTVTDANGVYSFADLPDGNYTLTLNKPAYTPTTSSGVLSTGQILNLATPVVKAPPASLQGVIEMDIGPAAGVSVALTDSAGTHATVSDANGNYRIDGIAYGAYSVTFSGSYLQTVTNTGKITAGQAATLNAWLHVLSPAVTVTAPLADAQITATPFMVTGSATNTETITVTVWNNGVTATYQGVVNNGTFSIPVEAKPGSSYINVYANNPWVENYVTGFAISATYLVRNLGDSGNAAVMELTGNYDAKKPDGSYNDQPRKTIATEYFKNHSDVDFLVYLSTFDYAMPEAAAQGFYLPVKNDVQGINQALMDNSGQFGSAGTLQGTIDLGNVTSLATNPYGAKLDETVTTLNHELMHRYGAYVRFKNPDGTLNSSLLGKDSAHWSYLLDSKGSIMYGNGWKDNADGTFTATSARNDYSPLDLYLMGMIPKEQVPPMLLIDNASIDKTKMPRLGDTISGTAKTVTIDDIIGAEGARIPGSTTAQKQFNVGFVLLTRAGDNTTAAAQAIETLRKAWAGRFAELTQGKGSVGNIAASLDVVVDTPVDGTTITGPDVTVSGSFINSTGVETGVTINGMPTTVTGNRFIVNHVPLQLGANSLVVTATDANGFTASATRNVIAVQGNYIRISSNIESGTGPLEASLRINASFIVTAPTINITGPGGTTITAISDTEYSAVFTNEGAYTVTVTATGPDGQAYTDSVIITVMSRYQLETLLRGKWEGMKQMIVEGNVEGILGFVASQPKSKYRDFFTALGSMLPELNNYLTTLELVYAANSVAKARIYRDEIINGMSDTIEYVIYFVNENGSWKLVQL